MAERVGFEPTVPVPLTAHTFQVCTVNLGIVNQQDNCKDVTKKWNQCGGFVWN